MSEYIDQLLCSGSTDTLHHIVDVGSGQVSIFVHLLRLKSCENALANNQFFFQGYVSRALQNLGLHVLALDSNEIQTSGAERWKAKELARRQKQFKRGKDAQSVPDSNHHCTDPLFRSHVPTSVPAACTASKIIMRSHMGSLTHQTICINSITLESSIHEWLFSGEDDQIASCTSMIGDLPVDGAERRIHRGKPVPVMMVALHACGSLTPDVLRAFLSNHRRPSAPSARIWTAQALVVVGCCYNLMALEGEPVGFYGWFRQGLLQLHWQIFRCHGPFVSELR